MPKEDFELEDIKPVVDDFDVLGGDTVGRDMW